MLLEEGQDVWTQSTAQLYLFWVAFRALDCR